MIACYPVQNGRCAVAGLPQESLIFVLPVVAQNVRLVLAAKGEQISVACINEQSDQSEIGRISEGQLYFQR
jgi:hypothetical protein